MKTLLRGSIALFAALVVTQALAQGTTSMPGLQPYTPVRIEWLALVCQTELRQSRTVDSPFSLDIIASDHETILIYVSYSPNVNREEMNKWIDTARKVVMMTAEGYGWDKWVKIRERVEMSKSNEDRQ